MSLMTTDVRSSCPRFASSFNALRLKLTQSEQTRILLIGAVGLILSAVVHYFLLTDQPVDVESII